MDAIEEVAIQTSNFAAEYGTAGGAMINMVTKSGTNTFHGSGYDYVVNEALNAHQPYLGTRNKIRQHDFGFTLGGPLRIPKVYDGRNKTFFFYSLEKFKQTNVVVSSVSVPTAAYRGGDFSRSADGRESAGDDRGGRGYGRLGTHDSKRHDFRSEYDAGKRCQRTLRTAIPSWAIKFLCHGMTRFRARCSRWCRSLRVRCSSGGWRQTTTPVRSTAAARREFPL